jgi:hypothetical protein
VADTAWLNLSRKNALSWSAFLKIQIATDLQQHTTLKSDLIPLTTPD